MTSKAIEGHKSSSNFSVKSTLPLMDGLLVLPTQIVCISLFLTLHLVLYSPLFILTLTYVLMDNFLSLFDLFINNNNLKKVYIYFVNIYCE